MSKTKPASEQLKKPATSNPVEQDIAQRMQNLNTDTLIFKALRRIEPGNQSGNTSKCWKLDGYTRFQAAKMHIVDHKSASEIFGELRDGMDAAKVSDRSLSGWLKSVRNSYGQVFDTQLGEIESAQAFAFQSGDLVAMLGITIAHTAPKFIAWFNAVEMDAMSVAEQHVMLRFMETQTSAAKVQAEARQREAHTLNLLGKIRDASADGQRGTRDPGEVLQGITALIDQLTGARTEVAA
jgi:hypothetical protein